MLSVSVMASSNKRFKSFLLGILFASVTWSISLYLYWKLTEVTKSQTSTKSPDVTSAKRFHQLKNDVYLPYEIDDKKIQRAKSKYFAQNKYKNSDNLINQLKPKLVEPIVNVDKGKTSQF